MMRVENKYLRRGSGMKKQQGVALVVVLSLLAGTAMIGMSGMQSAIVDERLSGNFRVVVRSFSDTETLAASLTQQKNRDELIELLDAVIGEDEGFQGETFNLGNLEDAPLISNNLRVTLESVAENFRKEWRPEDYDELDGDRKAQIESQISTMLSNLEIDVSGAEISEQGEEVVTVTTREKGVRGNARSESILEFTRVPQDSAEDDSTEAADDVFGFFGDYALLSGGGITVRGESNIDGRVHANSDVNANFNQQDQELSEEPNKGVTSNFEVEVPELTLNDIQSVFPDVVTLLLQSGRGNKPDYCELSGRDLEGKLYACTGTLKLSGSFTNGALYAERDIVHGGAVTMGDIHNDERSVSVFAMQDINFNGSTNIWGGFFYAGRDIRNTGSTAVNGSLVAFRDVNINGSSSFRHRTLPGSWGGYDDADDNDNSNEDSDGGRWLFSDWS